MARPLISFRIDEALLRLLDAELARRNAERDPHVRKLERGDIINEMLRDRLMLKVSISQN